MPVTTITSKGQITIPAEFRKRDGFHPGERVSVPARAQYNIEHERSADGDEEIEFQIKWSAR